MTEADIDDAIIALKRWFESQEINPQYAAACMLRLIACMLFEKAKVPDELEKSIEIVSLTLRHEIFNRIKP